MEAKIEQEGLEERFYSGDVQEAGLSTAGVLEFLVTAVKYQAQATSRGNRFIQLTVLEG